MSPNPILVPLSTDPGTERAIPFARRLADLSGAQLVLFTWSFDDGEAALEQHHLDELAAAMDGTVHVEARCSDELGPAHSIVRWARSHDAQIVMASHARNRLGEALFGSTAEEVVRLGVGPVVVVGPRAGAPRAGATGPIVTCLDGSDLAESALPVSIAWADRIGAPIELIEVAEPQLVQAVAASGHDLLESSYVAQAVVSIPEALRPSFEVLHGDPAHAIVDHADDRAELIAIATHGRSGVSRAVLGSTAMDVVRHARCPVVVIPPGPRADHGPGRTGPSAGAGGTA